MVASYPTPANIPVLWSNPAVESDMSVVKEAIHDARYVGDVASEIYLIFDFYCLDVRRSLRVDNKIANNVKVSFLYKTSNPEVLKAMTNQVSFRIP